MSSNSLMSVLCIKVCRLCVPNIMSLGISLKKLHLVKVGAFLLDTGSKFALFSLSRFKDEKLIKEQTYTKTEAYKLYSRLFWILLPNIIKIDPYNFELYRFKVCAFFWDTELVRAKVRCVCCVVSLPKFHYNDSTDLLPTCCGLRLVSDILTCQASLPCR